MWDDENAAVDAALSVMDNPPANTLPWGAEREEQLKNGPTRLRSKTRFQRNIPKAGRLSLVRATRRVCTDLVSRVRRNRRHPATVGSNATYKKHRVSSQNRKITTRLS
jgi:hypothetical protein